MEDRQRDTAQRLETFCPLLDKTGKKEVTERKVQPSFFCVQTIPPREKQDVQLWHKLRFEKGIFSLPRGKSKMYSCITNRELQETSFIARGNSKMYNCRTKSVSCQLERRRECCAPSRKMREDHFKNEMAFSIFPMSEV